MDTGYLKKKRVRQAQARLSGVELDMDVFREELGDEIPNIALSSLGRYRLLQALRYKFGPNFKNVGRAVKLLNYFDRQMVKAGED